ncbi:MAG TPA: cyclic nucleotide-binding domain-containing protein [Thermoanaerobaculia bacterium]|nr:cyclic nucleotide-binding domain-containing protein [Thermoanaerobaculia bacterium]
MSHSDELIAFLDATELFGGLPAGDLRELASCLTQHSLDPGEALIHEGDPADALYLLRSGRLEVSLGGAAAKPRRLIAHIDPGEVVGEAGLLSGEPRSASVRAEAASVVLRLGAPEFERLIATHPSVRRLLTRVVAQRLPGLHLAAIDLFGTFDDELVEALEEHLSWQRLRRGETLFRQGDESSSLYVLLRGRLRVVREGASGTRPLAEIHRGETVGEIGLLTGEPRTATVVAARDSELVRLDRAGFEKVIESEPRALMPIVRTLGRRLESTSATRRRRPRIGTLALLPLGPRRGVEWLTATLVAALRRHASVLVLDADSVDRAHGAGASRTPRDSLRWPALADWLHRQEDEHDLVVYLADRTATAWSELCLGQADRVVLVCQGDRPQSHELLAMVEQDPGATPRELVLLHPEGLEPHNTRRWLEVFAPERHHHARIGRDADAERVARFLSGRAIGVALGGGGARGFAHAGLQRAMAELGIPVDYLAGVSMGSLAAASWACGRDWRQTVNAFDEVFVKTKTWRAYTLPVISVFDAGALEAALERAFGDRRIEDLWTHFVCVATNVTRATPQLFERGRLARAVRASGAFPGLLPPVPIAGELLVDGGLMTNLPVETLAERCPGPIVANDVSREVEMEVDPALEESPSPAAWLWRRLREGKDASDFPRLGPLLLRSIDCREVARRPERQQAASVYLIPPVGRFGLVDFDALDEIVEAAYRYSLDALRASELGGGPDPGTAS